MVFQAQLNRRRMVSGAAGVAAVPLAVGVTSVRGEYDYADGSDDTGVAACLLAPEMTAGPFYVDDILVRPDIAENKAGVPLVLTMTVVDAESCAPIPNAAVEIWHCDAGGFYSGFVDSNPGGQPGDAGYIDDGSDPGTFLRGIQISDEDGNVTFDTIYPGWYAGRAIHIHLAVHLGGENEDGIYEGGAIQHVGQVGFDDSITSLIAEVEPYASRTSTFVATDQDGLFRRHLDNESVFVRLEQANPDAIDEGFTGSVLLGIDQTG